VIGRIVLAFIIAAILAGGRSFRVPDSTQSTLKLTRWPHPSRIAIAPVFVAPASSPALSTFLSLRASSPTLPRGTGVRPKHG
jgi:hypothetical protein